MKRANATRAITANSRRNSNSGRNEFHFRREWLPNPTEYFQAQGLKPLGAGDWKSALCPFHRDTKPSLRLHMDTGRFRCMACGAHGGDVLTFHMQRYGLGFIDAARALGAWESRS
jgi:hypothetical protein